MSYFTLFFDNAGGITLFCNQYSHLYNEPQHAARDVAHLITHGDDSVALWDGNEGLDISDYDAWADSCDSSIRSHEEYDVLYLLGKPEFEYAGAGLAEQDFYQELKHLTTDTTDA